MRTNLLGRGFIMDDRLHERLRCFVQGFVDHFANGKILIYKKSSFRFFDSQINNQQVSLVEYPTLLPSHEKFNLILADLPYGLTLEDYPQGTIRKRYRASQIDILNIANLLCDDGLVLSSIEPNLYSTTIGKEFEKELNSIGVYINAYIRAPKGLLFPETYLSPVFVIISRNRNSKIFLAEIEDKDQAIVIARNFISQYESLELPDGKLLERDSFFGFDNLHILQQIDRLKVQFSGFEEYQLSDLAESIKTLRSGNQFEDLKNAVYVPSIGNSDVVINLPDFKLKQHNYFQIVLKQNISNEYLMLFFQTALGRLILRSTFSESYISHSTKKRLEKALVVLPPKKIQDQIIKMNEKLDKLKVVIENITSELAINPIGTDSLIRQINKLSSVLEVLSDVERVRSKVREGESKYIEFKETLSLDASKQSKEKNLETSALKTIVAFLNTEGGSLLVGVRDDGVITGINHEIDALYKNKDRFLLHMKNLVKERIGEKYYIYIDWDLVVVDEMIVLEIDCKTSNIACYLDQKDFYVRTNPSSDKLEGPKLIEYVQQRFFNRSEK